MTNTIPPKSSSGYSRVHGSQTVPHFSSYTTLAIKSCSLQRSSDRSIVLIHRQLVVRSIHGSMLLCSTARKEMCDMKCKDIFSMKHTTAQRKFLDLETKWFLRYIQVLWFQVLAKRNKPETLFSRGTSGNSGGNIVLGSCTNLFMV